MCTIEFTADFTTDFTTGALLCTPVCDARKRVTELCLPLTLLLNLPLAVPCCASLSTMLASAVLRISDNAPGMRERQTDRATETETETETETPFLFLKKEVEKTKRTRTATLERFILFCCHSLYHSLYNGLYHLQMLFYLEVDAGDTEVRGRVKVCLKQQ